MSQAYGKDAENTLHARRVLIEAHKSFKSIYGIQEKEWAKNQHALKAHWYDVDAIKGYTLKQCKES